MGNFRITLAVWCYTNNVICLKLMSMTVGKTKCPQKFEQFTQILEPEDLHLINELLKGQFL